MSKKMKGVAFDEDVRAKIKHQTLVQDYLELQQETEAAKNYLVAMKQKKQTLEAEVRFLNRRYKFLSKTSSSTPKEMKNQNLKTTQFIKSKKDKVNWKKTVTLPGLPPLNMHSKTKSVAASRPPLVFDLEQNVGLNGFNLNQRVIGGNLSLGSEFNEKLCSGFNGNEAVVQSQAPKFDLNQISAEEAEESFEDQMKEQRNDLKLSIYKNVGVGPTNRAGKRKISWQDPVALRV